MKFQHPTFGHIFVFLKHDKVSTPTPDFPAINGEHRCTVAEIRGPDEQMLGRGVAICHENDNFKRSRGTALALARAFQNTDFDTEFRTKVWDRVWNGKYSNKKGGNNRGN